MIDFNKPEVKALADTLFDETSSETDFVRHAFEYVRDTYPHSADINADEIAVSASDVSDRLYEQGAEVNISVHEVNKLNESYEAITVTPEGSNIGVNVGIDKFFGALAPIERRVGLACKIAKWKTGV